MTLFFDLSRLIQDQFDKHGISYGSSMTLDRLVARYFEMNIRLIHPAPRHVHFSNQTYDSLGELSRRGKDDTSARNAWAAVFRLRQLLVEGANVNAFLSKNLRRATSWDGLLWHYGMHHFHLGSETNKDGFVKRSGHMLFAIVAITPTPWASGDTQRDQGISRDGPAWIRAQLVQMAWRWLRHQPDSALSKWFEDRTAGGRGRIRRVMVVALARKLLIALWRFCETGLVPTGARLA